MPGTIELRRHLKINSGKVFDLTMALEQVAEAYRAIKTLLRPGGEDPR